MSGESNPEEVLEGVGGPNGDGVLVMGLDSHVNEDLNSGCETQLESQFDGSGDKEGAEGAAAGAATDDSSDQDSSYVQVDRVETSNDSVHTDSDDMKITDDAGKEDMFVDAPDELGTSAPATDNEEVTERSVEGTRFYEEGGVQSYQLVDEVEHLRSTLEKVIAENSALYRDKQEGQLQSDGEISELREKLSSKDKDISDLNVKINQLSLSQESQDAFSQAQNQNYQYADAVISQLLASLSTVVYQGELVDDSLAAKASLVESSLSVLIQNYNEIFYDIEQLRQFLNHGTDTGVQEDFRSILGAARDELLAHRSKEAEIMEKFNQLEGQNKGLLEKLQMEKEVAAALNAEVAKTKAELEQEKAKSGTLREKLSLAVTKGKGLVQQRDSLRQSLAEKTRELEECMGKLEDRSRALEASEVRIVDLVDNENLLTSLQESLSTKDEVLVHVEEILSQGNLPQDIQFQNLNEKVKWLVDERNELTRASAELHRIEDVVSSFDFPETVTSSDVVSRVSWLKESSELANGEIIKLQDEIARIKVTADTEIQRLVTSLSDVIQEKDFMKTELIDLSEKFEGIVQKERHLLQEREDAVKMLVSASEITPDDREEFDYSSTNLPMLVEKCITLTVVQNSRSLESSFAATEDFERKITMLYVKDLELALCSQLLEEESVDRSQVKKLLDELKLTSERLTEVTKERDTLQNDLSRAEDKVSTLREKLSMAVKKGKGLVQERENMKGHLDEKNQEIEKLKREIHHQEFQLSDYSNKISNMSADLERIARLESEIVSVNDQRNHLEKLLKENEDKLEVVMDFIQSTALPIGLVFEDPIEKLKMIGHHVGELEASKVDSEKELEKVKQEASDLDMKLAEAHSVIKTLEDALYDKENNLKQITTEKIELETGKALVEQELQKLMEEARDQSMKLSEASEGMKSLQDVLSQAENDIRGLSLEKEEAHAGKVAAEMELEKAHEEVTTQTSKLTEALMTVRTLEDKLSQIEASISLLSEQHDQREEGKSVLEIELQNLKVEMNSKAEELANAYSTIKLLEDATSKTETRISELADEKKIVDEERLALSSKLAEAQETIKAHQQTIIQLQTWISTLVEEKSEGQTMRSSLEIEILKLKEEISSLEADLADARTNVKLLEDAASDAKTNIDVLINDKEMAKAEVSEIQTKLNACLEELSGTHGNIQNKYMELISLLKGLHILATNDTLASWRKRIQSPLENLKSMDLVLEDIRDRFEDIGHSENPSFDNSVTPSSTEFLTDFAADVVHLETGSSGMTSEQVDEVNKLFMEVVDRLHHKDKYISENIEGFCDVLDTFTKSVLQKLQLSKNDILGLADDVMSSKKTIEDLESGTLELNTSIADLQKDLSTLVSVSAEAEKQLSQLSSDPDLEFESQDSISEAVVAESDSTAGDKKLENNRYVDTAKKLSLATQKVHNMVMQLVKSKKAATATIIDLQNELAVARSSIEELKEERDLSLSRLSKLEADLQASQSLCDEMSFKIENHQANEAILIKKEAEVSSLYNDLLSKQQETTDSYITTSQLRELLDKANGVDLPIMDSDDLHANDGPSLVKKFGFIIDNVLEMQHQLVLLSRDRQEFQSTIEQQKSEIQQLQEKILEHSKISQDPQKSNNELSEFALHLEKVILKLGGTDASEDQTSIDARRLLSVLDRLTENLVLEYESSKSEVRQLRVKLLESQKAVDNLSMKAQSLEELIQHQTSAPQTVQERSFVMPSTSAGSEITEVEDVDLSGKSTNTPVPSAAQMRTFRKGSTDHLALNIDTDSAPLISNVGKDEDKGHVFKSLNTTGLIPKQGKLIADRIDGLWVNGGRVLMNQPRARLGVIAYWLVLHLWLLATIL